MTPMRICVAKEARTIRDYLRKHFLPADGHPYLIAGDFNDHRTQTLATLSSSQ